MLVSFGPILLMTLYVHYIVKSLLRSKKFKFQLPYKTISPNLTKLCSDEMHLPPDSAIFYLPKLCHRVYKTLQEKLLTGLDIKSVIFSVFSLLHSPINQVSLLHQPGLE